MSKALANGIQLRYAIAGEGDRTVVWIHGVGGSLDYWTEIVAQLPGLRHVTYDVRGMGQSEGSDGPVSLELWASDLAALLDALDIDHAIVAGTSMGGAIAQRLAIDHPSKVEALLLLSTSSRVGPAAEERWMQQADEAEAGGNARLAAARRAVAKYHMDEELAGVRVPALVVVGEEDRQTPPGGSVIISRCIEGAELEIYPGIGHNPLKEEHRALERVRDWLAQLPP